MKLVLGPRFARTRGPCHGQPVYIRKLVRFIEDIGDTYGRP